MNAGHQRGRPAIRCVGPLQVPTEFSCSRWPRSLVSARCLTPSPTAPSTLRCAAAQAARQVSQFRSRRDGPILAALRDRLAAWAAQRIDELTKAEPDMPVEDRAADTWEPLIVVADAAGGHWPDTARAACKALVDAADEADEERVAGDQTARRHPTGVHRPAARRSCRRRSWSPGCGASRNAPWDDFDLTTRKLAYRLKEFGVKPGRAERNTVRGYALEAFADAFSRYIRPQVANPSTTGDDQQQREDGSKSEDGSIRPHENIRPQETAGQPPLWTDWTDEDGCPTGNGSAPRESGRNSAPNHSRFTPDPPCFHCDKPVVSKTTDSQGRYAHLGCQTNQPQPEGLIT